MFKVRSVFIDGCNEEQDMDFSVKKGRKGVILFQNTIHYLYEGLPSQNSLTVALKPDEIKELIKVLQDSLGE